MDGKRLQDYWSQEVDALIATYRQFETLIPSQEYQGSAHRGEDGRFVEELLREYFSKYLPKGLEILTGFILRPAVKTGTTGKERRDEVDTSSSQLDMIVYDSERYPIFQRFGNSSIVPPEGVVAIISVKKHLNDGDIVKECQALWHASKLCKTLNSNDPDDKVRGPYLALVTMKSNIEKKTVESQDWIFNKVVEAYKSSDKPTFDELIGYIGSLSEWSLFKRRPDGDKVTNAHFISLVHAEGESHFGLQFILTGILSVFYHESRRNIRRPGFTAFPSGRNIEKNLGNIACNGER
ncbi:Hypothetical protein AKI40_1151 [Enterobacter sp. FY-07]|uniref:DUF6602 domain-containing protein n=1 Tax=Kosakonia oryzendophytica TaxID=1005665 RepID=UPI000777C1E5|nr:DUF6602 domain-containing protein [Kosakonia oryzendophytica]AMO47569.1 Hypothetical protein AKI40_1151 [Enterobacter sp. FY-07]WBT59283.1 hypothetical protein O9K67_05700 [Kosakonia oryzendophytica]